VVPRPVTLVEMTQVESDFPTNAILKWGGGSNLFWPRKYIYTYEKLTKITTTDKQITI